MLCESSWKGPQGSCKNAPQSSHVPCSFRFLRSSHCHLCAWSKDSAAATSSGPDEACSFGGEHSGSTQIDLVCESPGNRRRYLVAQSEEKRRSQEQLDRPG